MECPSFEFQGRQKAKEERERREREGEVVKRVSVTGSGRLNMSTIKRRAITERERE